MSWAAVAGAAVGVVGSQLGSKKSGNTTSVQSNDPWSGAVPFINQGLADARGWLSEGYPLDTMAAFRRRGTFGSPVNQEANNLAQSTLRGDYLNSNPFLNDSVSQAMGMAKSQINSQFAGNNYGSSAHQEWLGKGLMNAALPMMSQNYENERGRQFAALSQAPALQGMDYQNLGALQQADFMPWDFLQRYQNIVSGTGGGTSSTSSPYFTNPVNSALGGAMLGNQLYNSYTKNNQPASNQWADWGNMGSSTPFTQSGFADF